MTREANLGNHPGKPHTWMHYCIYKLFITGSHQSTYTFRSTLWHTPPIQSDISWIQNISWTLMNSNETNKQKATVGNRFSPFTVKVPKLPLMAVCHEAFHSLRQKNLLHQQSVHTRMDENFYRSFLILGDYARIY